MDMRAASRRILGRYEGIVEGLKRKNLIRDSKACFSKARRRCQHSSASVKSTAIRHEPAGGKRAKKVSQAAKEGMQQAGKRLILCPPSSHRTGIHLSGRRGVMSCSTAGFSQKYCPPQLHYRQSCFL